MLASVEGYHEPQRRPLRRTRSTRSAGRLRRRRRQACISRSSFRNRRMVTEIQFTSPGGTPAPGRGAGAPPAATPPAQRSTRCSSRPTARRGARPVARGAMTQTTAAAFAGAREVRARHTNGCGAGHGQLAGAERAGLPTRALISARGGGGKGARPESAGLLFGRSGPRLR